jgi:hypothetical protein
MYFAYFCVFSILGENQKSKKYNKKRNKKGVRFLQELFFLLYIFLFYV